MENEAWLDTVLGRRPKVKKIRNVIVDEAWNELKAGKISAFEYNRIFREALKYESANY